MKINVGSYQYRCRHCGHLMLPKEMSGGLHGVKKCTSCGRPVQNGRDWD